MPVSMEFNLLKPNILDGLTLDQLLAEWGKGQRMIFAAETYKGEVLERIHKFNPTWEG
jgi:hypothetical protein